jgi:hypothetical protein
MGWRISALSETFRMVSREVRDPLVQDVYAALRAYEAAFAQEIGSEARLEMVVSYFKGEDGRRQMCVGIPGQVGDCVLADPEPEPFVKSRDGM